MKGSMVVPAEQNEKDYQALVDAVATGRVRAVMGLLTANPRPRLTGPLLLRPGSGPGPELRWSLSGAGTTPPRRYRCARCSASVPTTAGSPGSARSQSACRRRNAVSSGRASVSSPRVCA